MPGCAAPKNKKHSSYSFNTVKIFPYPSNKIIAVLALTVLVYANSLNGGFVWDDSGLIAAQVEYFEDIGNLSSLFLNPHLSKPPITGRCSGLHFFSIIIYGGSIRLDFI